MRRVFPALLMLVSISAWAATQVTISPTTTLSAQTSNNTAAWSGYTADASDNPSAGNVNRANLHSLLNDSTVFIGARLIPFWGTSYHPYVGYSENDPSVVTRQVNDAMGRGIQYFVIDWYGPPNTPDQTFNNTSALNLKKAAEATSGKFRFALSLDGGALTYCANTSGCSLTATVIKDINYILANYAGSSAYQTTSGIPWIWTFDPDRFGTIDWNYVRSHLSRKAYLIFRNEQGFSHPQSDGAFSWTCNASKDSMSCLDGFYWNYTHTYYNKIAVGSAYPGFNDNIATWSTTKRYQDQECGILWLNTWNEANVYPFFSSLGHPIHHLQVASWNDYEEGHQIETGVDNCVDLAASISSHTLSWGIGSATNYYTGAALNLQQTIDHFNVWVSTDGQNLMNLTTLPASARSLDLSQYSFSSAVYLFVQAIGKPSIQNKMTAAIRWTGSGSMTPAISISSPGAGASVTSPVHVAAKANFTAARSEVWVDSSTKAYSVTGGSVDTYLNLSTGSHVITVAAYNSTGTKYTNSVSVNVTAGTRSITLSSPGNGATVTSPATIKGSASGPATITAMQVYVDSVLAYQVKNTYLVNTQLSLTKGTHYIVLKAWDSSGANWATPAAKVGVN